MTREELVSLRDKALKAMSSPEEIRSGNNAIKMRNSGDLLKTIARLDSEIAALDAASSGNSTGCITRLYAKDGLS